MPKFGTLSQKNLVDVHPKLLAVLNLAIQEIDFTVICGRRGKEDQNNAFRRGNSAVQYPNSAHNPLPCCAVDFIPYPFTGWNDLPRFRKIAETIQRCGLSVGTSIRSGGDWRMNGEWFQHKPVDGGHVELNPWRDFVIKT